MTVQQLAYYYREKGVFSYPGYKEINFTQWSNINAANKTFNALTWDSKDENLFGIAGVKGVRCIKINVVELEEVEIESLIRLLSRHLFNNEYYPWVIRKFGTIYILVDCGIVPDGEDVSFNNISLLLRTTFPLPIESNDSSAEFYFRAIPMEHPMPVEYSKLYDVVKKIDNLLTKFINNKRADTSASKEITYKNKILIVISTILAIALLVGIIISDFVLKIFLVVLFTLLGIGFIYMFLIEPKDSLIGGFIEAYKETPKAKRGKLILAGVAILLFLFLIVAIVLFMYVGLPHLMNKTF